jgi:hypothetical protein
VIVFIVFSVFSVIYDNSAYVGLLDKLYFSYFIIQGVQLKSGLYFNMSNLFTKIYNMLYYTANLYLQ